ncbi:organic hydroperoxide resistance protein [Galbibacter sp. EGI 63066]|uniref:organic hydroperoxide resistance protein n=1 Tax=Galbibacter sp. EGI 63066 TaxID=2993559 RepID=UPI0022498BC4|nr:organic hydroperoxide resistance protein [Galbibacter sp. EGI 63066]MCX2680283.1 organic hydroperoxide resistance protein [Galbibacter sp. EGI 63066]
MKVLYSAVATTTGGRGGYVKSDDEVIDMNLELPKELGGKGGKFTNPEQLFAAGYSACFGSALQFVAKENKVDLDENFKVMATVGIGKHPELGGFLLEVVLDVTLPGIDKETGEKLVAEAHEVCPYSRATQDNIDVTLNLMV